MLCVVVRRVSIISGGAVALARDSKFENREIEREQGRLADWKGSSKEVKYISARPRRCLCVLNARMGRSRTMGLTWGFLLLVSF